MDRFRIGTVELIHGDFLSVQLPEPVDLIITSPPYNVGIDYGSFSDDVSYEEYLKFNAEWLRHAFDLLKDDGRLCLNIPLDKNKFGNKPTLVDIVYLAQQIGFQHKSTIIWNKSNVSKRTAWGSWLSASAPSVIAPVEVIEVMYKKQWKKQHKGITEITRDEFIQWTNGLWSFPGETRKLGHPAPFPEELPKRCMKLFAYKEDIVLDPFAGSGTTLIVALKLGRKAIGVELDKNYFDLAVNRLKKVANQFGLFLKE